MNRATFALDIEILIGRVFCHLSITLSLTLPVVYEVGKKYAERYNSEADG